MAKYTIITDSSCDLSKEYREANNIDYVRMMLNWVDENGVDHEGPADLDWKELSTKEFYDIIRSDRRMRTAQVPMSNYIDVLEPILKRGEDILYLACSSGLSASLNVAKMIFEQELKEKYPDNKLVVVDTLRAGMAQGMIVMKAIELQKEGKTIEEVKEYVEEKRLHYKEIGIPETLLYLRRAGRVSAPAATFGNIIGLKPILEFDDKGMNVAKEKAIGKRKAFAKMAARIKEDIVDPENQEIYMMNADCKEEDIEDFKKAILAEVKVKNIIVMPLGPIIGASSGPGTIIVNYYGK